MKSGFRSLRHLLGFLGILFLPLIVLTGTGAPFASPLGVVTSAMVLWITGVVPAAVTGMLIPCLAILFGILSPVVAFSSFGNPILALFVGVFLLVRAVQKYGLDERIARTVLEGRMVTASPERIVAVTAVCAWLAGMWMSNTATCALFMPICLGMLNRAKVRLSDEQFRIFTTRLLLTCAYTPSIGGMATPVGSVPNAIATSSWPGAAFPSHLVSGCRRRFRYRLFYSAYPSSY